ncbi:hypothetical protein HDV05_001701 [Chytridiales sp. JEL 0842]|nr:hypothetical protein HDV05_001701 [Chytridiales sp. JEL 0842]
MNDRSRKLNQKSSLPSLEVPTRIGSTPRASLDHSRNQSPLVMDLLTGEDLSFSPVIDIHSAMAGAMGAMDIMTASIAPKLPSPSSGKPASSKGILPMSPISPQPSTSMAPIPQSSVSNSNQQLIDPITTSLPSPTSTSQQQSQPNSNALYDPFFSEPPSKVASQATSSELTFIDLPPGMALAAEFTPASLPTFKPQKSHGSVFDRLADGVAGQMNEDIDLETEVLVKKALEGQYALRGGPATIFPQLNIR